MKRIFTKKFRNLILLFIGVFILMFLFRLGYGYTLDIDDGVQDNASFDSFESDKRNFASNDYKKGYDKPGLSENQTNNSGTAVDQKYEKIAEVKAATHEFDSDELYIRDQIKVFDGIVQYEKKYGNEGKRKLQLQVGVPPANFDSLYFRMIGIGITHFKQIVKNDKTNEYLELNAKKASLEKTHSSLMEFKKKGGRIEEFVNLENRILEIEVELQNLGVNLGDFDKSNEFCTVKIGLTETLKPSPQVISFYHRLKVALEWTIAWYLWLVSSAFFVFLGAFVILLIIERGIIAAIKNLINKNNEDK